MSHCFTSTLIFENSETKYSYPLDENSFTVTIENFIFCRSKNSCAEKHVKSYLTVIAPIVFLTLHCE